MDSIDKKEDKSQLEINPRELNEFVAAQKRSPGRPRGNAEPKPQKLSKLDKMHEVVAAMLGSNNHPPFPRNFLTVLDGNQKPSFVERGENGILRYIDLEQIGTAIIHYSNSFMEPRFALTPEESFSCAKMWASLVPPSKLDDFHPFLEKSQAGQTFCRLPFDLVQGETPLFDEIMGRATNAPALQSFVGAVFTHAAQPQQYLHIHGKGSNSKGAFARVLTRAFGVSPEGGAIWCQPPTEGGARFWTEQFLNKRLGVFGDLNEWKFTVSQIWKALTGNDYITIEKKGGKTWSQKLFTLFVVISNDMPGVSSQESDQRRPIFTKFAPLTGADGGQAYEDALFAELPYFAFKCREHYLNITGFGKSIACDREDLAVLAEQSEERFDVLFQENFKLTSDLHLVDKERAFVSPITLQYVLRTAGLRSNSEQHWFHKFLRDKYNIALHRVRLTDDVRENRYLGMERLTSNEMMDIQVRYQTPSHNKF